MKSDFVCGLVVLFFLGLLRSSTAIEGGVIDFEYHDYQFLGRVITALSTRYPELTYPYSIGTSVKGRELWVLAIAGHDVDKHIVGRPEAKYVGNMHGDEVIGREMLIHFAEWLLMNYGSNAEVSQFLDNTRLHILFSMNPDGFEEARPARENDPNCRSLTGRFNDLGFDLNRNFPDYFEKNQYEIQIETQRIMTWLEEHQFVLSANLHGGALLANYPFDNIEPEIKGDNTSVYSPSPDDDLYRYLAETYSFTHKKMHILNETKCGGRFSGFENGVTNGAEWYIAVGGMQDYNYMFAGCMEITLELSCCKYPVAEELPGFWEENRDALMEFIKQVHRGIKGIVHNEEGVPIRDALVTIVGRERVQHRTTRDGEFWRMLLPGSYVLQVSKEGYNTWEMSIQVSNYVYDVENFQVVLSRTDDGSGTAPPKTVSLVVIVMASLLGLMWHL